MYESALAEAYVRAVCSEITTWQETSKSFLVDTIYFGGGTPSLLSATQIERILAAVHNRFTLRDGLEVTLEINPGDGGTSQDAKTETMREWPRLGINRASFGAQTFDDRELKLLGRTHDSGDIGDTFQRLRAAGFANINFDLIAGLPGQTLAGWKRNCSL